MTRVSLAAARDAGLALPAHAGRLSPGIVHLGIGAFARAHTAVYTDAAMIATGDDRWGILGVSQRSATVPDKLAPQDGVFGVLTRSQDQEAVSLVASVLGAVDGSRHGGTVVAAIADPGTSVVTLTVTEKGYRLAPAGGLNLDDPEIRADLSGARGTAVGQLAHGLLARDGAPITVVSCDNLPGNGHTVRRALEDFAVALGGSDGRRLTDALAQSVRTPDTMVDRMVPATTAADLVRVAELLGLRDEAAVVAEPFRQWIIADDFAADRPAWEQAGARFVDDVTAWEEVKLRILNAGHSLIAYLGLLGGQETIAASVRRPAWESALRRMIDDDVVPHLRAPEGLDVRGYSDDVIARFANPHLGHTVRKVGSDGSQKIPLRILSTVRAARAAGQSARWAALAIAAWAAYVGSCPPGDLDDPHAPELSRLVGAAAPEEAGLALLEFLDPDLAADPLVADAVRDWSRVFAQGGLLAVEREINAQQ